MHGGKSAGFQLHPSLKPPVFPLDLFNTELSPQRYWLGPRSLELDRDGGGGGGGIPNNTLSPEEWGYT